MAVAVSLDRQEKATDTSTESAIQVRKHSISSITPRSTPPSLPPPSPSELIFFLILPLQQVEKDLQIPVLSIVRLKHLVSYVREAAQAVEGSGTGADSAEPSLLSQVESYRAQHGVEY